MTITRRSVLAGMGGAAALTLIPGPNGSLLARANGVEFEIVADGVAKAVVCVPGGSTGERRQVIYGAGRMLRDVILQATGVEVRQIYSNVPSSWTEHPIYLDRIGPGTTDGFSNDGLGPDEYAIDLTPTSMTILGGDITGTMVGVIELIETVCGAQFLLPGPEGTKVAAAESLSATSAVIDGGGGGTPDFVNRRIYAYGTMANAASSDPNNVFGSRLRLMNRAKYSHNMGAIFDPAKYADSHPEIYPVRNGERRIPSGPTNAGWNPRWQDPVTVPPAVEYAVAELSKEDSTGWVAMGINDSGGYSDDTLELATTDADGMFSLSNVYCAWLNAVAEGVEEQLGHTDFRLGFLAYNDIRSAPDFDMHSTVVPYITRDLYGWVSPELEAHDRALLDGWDARCVELGWWDYPWGSPFMVPRLFHRTQQRSLQALHDGGVRHVFAEMDQNIGEGSKVSLYAKLLWDVDVDIIAARDDWCTGMVGTAGAPHLRAFDEHWNTWWATTALDTEYVRSGKGSSYLWYLDTGYLNKVTESDIETSQGHLDAAAAAAQTPGEKARISVLTRQHEFYRASVLSYDRDVPEPTTALEAKQLFLDSIGVLDERMALARRRTELVDEFHDDPVMRHRFEGPHIGLLWNGWPSKALWSVGQFIRREGRRSAAASVYAHVRDASVEHPSPDVRSYAATLLAVAEGRTVNRAVNGDFASGEIGPWQIDTGSGWPGGEPRLVTDVRREAPASVRIVGPTSGGGVSQTVSVNPGWLRASFWVRTTDVADVIGFVTPTWLVWDGDGRRTLYRGEVLALASTTDGWTECAMAQVLPDGTETVACYLSYLKIAAQTEFFVTDISYTQVA